MRNAWFAGCLMLVYLALASVGALGIPAEAHAADISFSPYYMPWHQVARADLIVIGHLHAELVRNPRATSSEDDFRDKRLEISIDIKRFLKGPKNGRDSGVRRLQVVNSFPGVGPRAAFAYLDNLQNFGDVILFCHNDSRKPLGVVWCTDYDPVESILPCTPEMVQSVEREVENQERLVKAFPQLSVAKPQPEDERIKLLIDMTVDSRTQQEAFESIVADGPSVVPSLIRLMDDHRRLGRPYLALKNHPGDGREDAYSQYIVYTVQDALITIIGRLVDHPMQARGYDGITRVCHLYLCYDWPTTPARILPQAAPPTARDADRTLSGECDSGPLG